MKAFVRRFIALPLLLGVIGCATRSARRLEKPDPCPRFVAARPKFPRVPEYPAPLLRARMSGESNHEVLVDRLGNVRDVRIVGTTFMVFALSADVALRKSKYFPAVLDGRDVGSRFWVRIPFGVPKDLESSPARNRVSAFVPGKEPARARWQLAGGVHRLTVAADIASVPPNEVSVVAIAPSGAKRVLVRPGTVTSRQIRASVRTGDFFSKSGEYRVSLRHGDRTIGEGGFTIADDENSAIVNACGTP
jgi:Gram-negative bacterial TonB protein C-terminal